MADISAFSPVDIAGNTTANFGPTAVAGQQQTAANTQLTQQQTVAANQQNQILAARMPLILAGIHDDSVAAHASGTSDTTPGQDIADEDKSAVAPNQNFYQPALIDAALRAKYLVQQWTPQESDALKRAYQRDPTDQYGMGPKRVMAMHDMRIQQQTQNSQVGARDDFDKMHAVTDAPDGNAMDVLEASHPETVAAIRKQFAKDPDADHDEDAAARMFSAHVAGAVHQYTGREAVKGDDGVYRDKDTGITIPGVEKVGLSTDQYIKLAHEAITPSVDMPDGNGGSIKVAPWKAAQMAGAKNINGPGDWVMVRASQQGLPGAASTLSPNSAPKQEARSVAQAALDKVQGQHASAPDTNPSGTPKSQNGTGTARNAQGNIDPKLTDALHDPDFDYHPSNNGVPWKGGIGASPPPPVMDDMKKQTDARNDLAKTANQGVGAASAALTMYKAAQDVLAKGNYDGGAWDAELSKVAGKYLPVGWQNTAKTGDYQEVAKMLGTAALQSGKGIFAKMTQMEAKMLTTQLSPAPGMQPAAMQDMISKGAKMAQYSLDSAKRVPAYLAARKDANDFNSWNQTHFPQETETQVTPAKPNDGVAPPPKYNDAQVKMYMQKYGLQDEQATRKALGIL